MLLAPETDVEPEPGRDRAQADRRGDVRAQLSRGGLLRSVLLREALRPLLSVVLLRVLVVAIAVLAGELDGHVVGLQGTTAARRGASCYEYWRQWWTMPRAEAKRELD